jgi:DNA-binding transcriptional ArsR family regulator
MEEKIKHNFTAIPTNLTIILDINCRSMLFTLCQLASYYADKEGWFFRTNADLAEESKLSQKLVIATIDTLYSNGIIDVKSVGKSKGKHSNYYRLNIQKFIEYEKYSMDELKNHTLHINTVEGYNKKGYSPSYLKNYSPTEFPIIPQELPNISPIFPQITNNKYNIEIIENKENVNNKEIKEDISNNINNIIIEEKEEDKHIRILESLRGEGVKVSDVLSKLAKEHWDTYVYFKNDLKKSENEKIKRVYWNNRELIEELNEKYSPKNQTYQIA